MSAAGRWLVGAALAAGTTAAVRRATRRSAPGGQDRWTRTNHRGEPISLLEGPAVVAGLVVGAAAAAPSGRAALAHTLASAGAGGFGLVDDLAEDTSTRSKGLRGHVGAALHGTLTTGGLKVLGIGTTSVLAAAAAPRTDPATSLVGRGCDVLLDGALVAAAANVVNLLDLRPGRALKASVAVASLCTLTGAGSAAGAVLGSAAAAAGDDLAEHDMLGDSGANALGALLGSLVVQGAPRGVRRLVLVGLVGLTLASERVSFSAVIARTPWLDAVDQWGRRAPAPADSAQG